MQVTANGIAIEVEEEGEGEPVLLIMGIGAQLLHWPAGFVRAIAEHGFRVIRFDNRDMGKSQRMTGHVNALTTIARRVVGLPIHAPYTLSDMALDAIGVLDALDIEAAHVVGASMGGMIAQRMAIDHPSRVLSLVSIMSTPGRRRDNLASPSALRALLRRPDTTNADTYTESVSRFFDAVGSRDFPRDEEEFRRVCHQIYDRGLNPAGFVRQLAAIAADGNRSAELTRVTCPTTAIHGLADPLISPNGGRATAAAIPGAEFVGVEKMGHDLPRPLWPMLAQKIAQTAQR